MYSKLTIILLTALCCLLLSCESTKKPTEEVAQPDNFDLGLTQAGYYHNDFFGLDIYFDSTWNVQEKEDMERLTKIGQDIVTGDNKELEAIIDASKVNTAYLLTVFKHPLGASVEYNPNFLALVENIRLFPGIETGEDYLFQVKKMLDQMVMKFEYGELTEKRVGKKIFHVLPVETTYLGTTTKQHYFSAVERGFCISFILSFSTEKEREELYAIIDKIRM